MATNDKGGDTNSTPKIKQVRLRNALLYPGLGSTQSIEENPKAYRHIEYHRVGVRVTLRTSKDKTTTLVIPYSHIEFIEEE